MHLSKIYNFESVDFSKILHPDSIVHAARYFDKLTVVPCSNNVSSKVQVFPSIDNSLKTRYSGGL
jgi:hypothetical protein